MSFYTDYQPSPVGWVHRQQERIDAAGDTRAVDIMGLSVVVVAMRGAKTGRVRRVPLMRVEHNGTYAVVASDGGAAQHPAWFHNLKANPEVECQDGTETFEALAHEADPAEHDEWWPRCVKAFPPYAEYQTRTERLIPVFVIQKR